MKLNQDTKIVNINDKPNELTQLSKSLDSPSTSKPPKVKARLSGDEVSLAHLIDSQRKRMSLKLNSLFHKKKKKDSPQIAPPKKFPSDSSLTSSLNSSPVSSSSSYSETSSPSFSPSESMGSQKRVINVTTISSVEKVPKGEEQASLKRRTEEELSFMDEYLGRCQTLAIKWILFCVFFAIIVGIIELTNYHYKPFSAYAFPFPNPSSASQSLFTIDTRFSTA